MRVDTWKIWMPPEDTAIPLAERAIRRLPPIMDLASRRIFCRTPHYLLDHGQPLRSESLTVHLDFDELRIAAGTNEAGRMLIFLRQWRIVWWRKGETRFQRAVLEELLDCAGRELEQTICGHRRRRELRECARRAAVTDDQLTGRERVAPRRLRVAS
jgi:hypothetical protein